MQTLIFNTTSKTVKVYDGYPNDSTLLYSYDEVPTVGLRDNYYEVMQKYGDDRTSIPVLRVPIANTNMQIIK